MPGLSAVPSADLGVVGVSGFVVGVPEDDVASPSSERSQSDANQWLS